MRRFLLFGATLLACAPVWAVDLGTCTDESTHAQLAYKPPYTPPEPVRDWRLAAWVPNCTTPRTAAQVCASVAGSNTWWLAAHGTPGVLTCWTDNPNDQNPPGYVTVHESSCSGPVVCRDGYLNVGGTCKLESAIDMDAQSVVDGAYVSRNTDGNKTMYQLPNGDTWQTTQWDALKRPITITNPDGTVTTLTYSNTKTAQVATMTRQGATTTYTYNADGTVDTIITPEGTTYEPSYTPGPIAGDLDLMAPKVTTVEVTTPGGGYTPGAPVLAGVPPTGSSTNPAGQTLLQQDELAELELLFDPSSGSSDPYDATVPGDGMLDPNPAGTCAQQVAEWAPLSGPPNCMTLVWVPCMAWAKPTHRWFPGQAARIAVCQGALTRCFRNQYGN